MSVNVPRIEPLSGHRRGVECPANPVIQLRWPGRLASRQSEWRMHHQTSGKSPLHVGVFCSPLTSTFPPILPVAVAPNSKPWASTIRVRLMDRTAAGRWMARRPVLLMCVFAVLLGAGPAVTLLSKPSVAIGVLTTIALLGGALVGRLFAMIARTPPKR